MKALTQVHIQFAVAAMQGLCAGHSEDAMYADAAWALADKAMKAMPDDIRRELEHEVTEATVLEWIDLRLEGM